MPLIFSNNITVSPNRTTTYTLTVVRNGKTSNDNVTVVVENCESKIQDEEFTFDQVPNVVLYPNPTKNNLNLRLENLQTDYSIIITDTKGSVMFIEEIKMQKH